METIYAAINDGFILDDARYDSADALVALQGAVPRRWPISVRVGRATFEGHEVGATYGEARAKVLARLR